ncbi:hypothetical protein MUK42_28636 [Musa troglodytarum]|uniref:Uncharacterized protein n=1 Tax=Musa troglodytarum TaxID=320322 RepID=A0A9E7F5V4_9LILI|nr:hypothetical protein MUK42_28636 [Musa troglodytarum]
MTLGVFEQYVSPEVCLQFPGRAKESVYWIFYNRAFCTGSQIADLIAAGTSMFTCILHGFSISLWGSVAKLYLFLIEGLQSTGQPCDPRNQILQEGCGGPAYVEEREV